MVGAGLVPALLGSREGGHKGRPYILKTDDSTGSADGSATLAIAAQFLEDAFRIRRVHPQPGAGALEILADENENPQLGHSFPEERGFVGSWRFDNRQTQTGDPLLIDLKKGRNFADIGVKYRRDIDCRPKVRQVTAAHRPVRTRELPGYIFQPVRQRNCLIPQFERALEIAAIAIPDSHGYRTRFLEGYSMLRCNSTAKAMGDHRFPISV